MHPLHWTYLRPFPFPFPFPHFQFLFSHFPIPSFSTTCGKGLVTWEHFLSCTGAWLNRNVMQSITRQLPVTTQWNAKLHTKVWDALIRAWNLRFRSRWRIHWRGTLIRTATVPFASWPTHTRSFITCILMTGSPKLILSKIYWYTYDYEYKVHVQASRQWGECWISLILSFWIIANIQTVL